MNTQKKAPTWATVVGILGICFGVLGLLGGSYEIMMPMMMSMQQKMMDSMKESIKEAPQEEPCPNGKRQSAPQMDPEAVFEAMDEFMTYPPWYKRFAFINGGLQLLLGALYVLASIFLLLVKGGAATFFLSVAGISAIRNMAAVGIGLSAGSFFAFWTVTSGAIGFLIDLVLIIVVVVSDRSVYKRATA